MTFTVRNLSVLAYSQGFTLWHYKAPNLPFSVVLADGFFNHASDMLASGDIIMISAQDGGGTRYLSVSDNSVACMVMS